MFERDDKAQRREDYAAYGLAYLVILIFGVISVMAVLGIADTTEATVASVVFAVLGYSAAKIDPILARFFSQFFQEVWNGDNDKKEKEKDPEL